MTKTTFWKKIGQQGCVVLVIFIASSASVCAEMCAEARSCQVNASNFDEIKGLFKESVTAWGVLGVNFWIKGIEWQLSDNVTGERIFDPNWWSWHLNDAGPLLEMPIDYDILSMGILALRVRNMDLQFQSTPPGCISSLPDSCKMSIVEEILLNVTRRKDVNDDELICQSFIQQASVVTGNIVGVGKRCRNRNSLMNGVEDMETESSAHHSYYDVRRVMVFVFGTILPLLGIPLVAAWADFKPLSVGHGFAEYAGNKLSKYSHFKLRGVAGCTTLDNKTVIVAEKDLLDFEGPVMTISSLATKDLPVRSVKLKCTLVFLLQYIPIGLWGYYYATRRDTLKYLRTAEEVVFNLRYNPFAWLQTDKNLWPYKFAVFLIFLNALAFLSMAVWWLLELATLRKALMELILKHNVYGETAKGHFRSRRTSVPLEQIFRNIFIVLCSTVIVGMYMVVFSLFHSAIYTLGGVLVNIELLASWITGIGLFIYYVNKSYTGVKAKYTDIKRLVFEEGLKQRVYKGTHVTTCDILVNDTENCHMIDRDKQDFQFEWKRSEGPVFLYSKEKTVMIHKRMFLSICKKIEPLGASLKRAGIDLLFTLFFLGLVVFTIAVFRPYNASSEMSVVVTSLVTLLTALVPSISEMSTCQEQVELEKSVLQYKVKKAVGKYKPRFRTLLGTKPLNFRGTVIRRVARDDLDAINLDTFAPIGTMVIGKLDSGNETANEFSDHSSSLPTPGNFLGPSPIAEGGLPTIPSGLVVGEVGNDAAASLSRKGSTISVDSGMMVLAISDLNIANRQVTDDIKFADDSDNLKENEPLMTKESPV